MASLAADFFRVKVNTVFSCGISRQELATTIPDKFIQFINSHNIVNVKNLIKHIRKRYQLRGTCLKLYLEDYLLQAEDPIQVLKDDDSLKLSIYKDEGEEHNNKKSEEAAVSGSNENNFEFEDQITVNGFSENHKTPEVPEASIRQQRKKRRREVQFEYIDAETSLSHGQVKKKKKSKNVEPVEVESMQVGTRDKKKKRKKEMQMTILEDQVKNSTKHLQTIDLPTKRRKRASCDGTEEILFEQVPGCAARKKNEQFHFRDAGNSPDAPEAEVRKSPGICDFEAASHNLKPLSVLPEETPCPAKDNYDQETVANTSVEDLGQWFTEKKKRKRRRKRKQDKFQEENAVQKQTTVFLRNPTLFAPPAQKKKWANSTSKHTRFEEEQEEIDEPDRVLVKQCENERTDHANVDMIRKDDANLKSSTAIAEETSRSSRLPLLSMIPRSVAVSAKQTPKKANLEKSPTYCRPMPPEFASSVSQKAHEVKVVENPLLNLVGIGMGNVAFHRKMKRNHLAERQKNVSRVYSSSQEAAPRESLENDPLKKNYDDSFKEFDHQTVPVKEESPGRTTSINNYDYIDFKKNIYADMNFQSPASAKNIRHIRSDAGRRGSEEHHRDSQTKEVDRPDSHIQEEPPIDGEAKKECSGDAKEKHHDDNEAEEERCHGNQNKEEDRHENLNTGENQKENAVGPTERLIEKDTVLPSDILPNKGWFLSFRMLELSPNGCPEISDVKNAEVVDIDVASKSVTLRYISKFAKRGKGESFVCVEGLDPAVDNCITLNWTDVIEPRQLLAAN